MKLKGRLIIAFMIMIVMPIMLITLTSSMIVRVQIKSINQAYGVETDTLHVITNPIQILNRLTRGVYNDIKLHALKSPERLEDLDYIKSLNDKVKDKYSFIALRKNGEYIYVGNEEKLDLIRDLLPRFGDYYTEVDGGIYVGGVKSFLVKAQDFFFTDGGEGTVLVITDLNILVPQLKSLAVQSVIAFMIIIFVTAALLILWIYNSILKPLNILRIATNKMKEGNLDIRVESYSEDEIGQLCEDFEEMRIRLKELIEDRLQNEENMKEMMSNISHDLKTPLTTIMGYTEGLIDGVADTRDKQEKYLRTIVMKARDMVSLVDELSFYAKIDNNTIPYLFKNINLKDYFADCIEELRLELSERGIRVEELNNADSSIEVMADSEQLKRVINNIVGNSVKYMRQAEGIIKFSIIDIGDYIQVDIEDNGVGIQDKDMPYIFERFYRADISRGSRGGSGLGLAISKKIIEDHTGKIWAESKPGIGTKISFTLKKRID